MLPTVAERKYFFLNKNMDKIQIKKQKASVENLDNFTKEELVAKIKALEAHNLQLQNLLNKSKNEEKKEKTHNNTFDFSQCNYRHILLRLFYLGWDYQGFAVQEDTTNTIEYHLFNALIRTCLIKDRTSSNYHRCGRTDKGVSSFGQTISLTVRSKSDNINEEIDYCKVLNRVLPDNIRCVAWHPIKNDFSSRFDCKNRTYKYYFPKGNLDLKKMEEAAKYLIGTHDFRNFCKMDVGNGVTEFIRNIFEIKINPTDMNKTENEYRMYEIEIIGNAFLWHQIRCVVAVLFLIGQNKEEISIVNELLDVDKNPRKPQYNMASEIPLNLFSCEYDNLNNWQYHEECLNNCIEKLKNNWTMHSIKENMIKKMIEGLKNELKGDINKCLSEHLLNGVKSKKYIPVMKRQRCESLEDKIKHYAKRNRIEIVNKSEDCL